MHLPFLHGTGVVRSGPFQPMEAPATNKGNGDEVELLIEALTDPLLGEQEEEEEEDDDDSGDDLNPKDPPALRRNATNTTSQLAIIGSSVCPIESLDYEFIENDLLRQDWRGLERGEILQYILLKWSLCLLVGICAGVLGFSINMLVENLAGFKFMITSDLMLKNRYVAAFMVFALTNLVLVMASSSITAYYAPAAAGSGIPEVKAYLNGVDAPNIFSPKTLLVKIVASILAVAASLTVGKAGPMIHMGACIAAWLGQGGSRKYGLTCRWLRFFKNDRDRRDLVTCGSAAGVAAAFRAPVGGVLFALEALSSWWRSALLWRAFFTTAVVAVVLRALINICKTGDCGLFGQGGLIMFDVTSADVMYHIVDLPPVILLGVIGGIFGSFYNFIVHKVLRFYNRINEKGPRLRLLLASCVSMFVSCCLFGLPWIASCKPCPEGAGDSCPSVGRSGNFKKFQCPPGHYNDLASLFFNTNDDAIKNLLSSGTDDEFQWLSLIVFFITSYFLGILSNGIATPTGFFVPVILTGTTYGRFIGKLVSSLSSLDHGLFALLGAASFLGGTMRMTVSVGVIMLELTNNLLLLPLVMVVLLISKTVADSFNANIFDVAAKLKGLPYLEARAEPYMRNLTVSDVVTGPLRSFNGVEKVSNIVQVLKTTRHNGFPVMEEETRSSSSSHASSSSPLLFGIILRAHLLVLLKKKAFTLMENGRGRMDVDVVKRRFASDDFAKKGFCQRDSVEDLKLTDGEMEMYVDLRPFTNTSPYTVVDTMSLAKALILFREVGLRHLLVTPKSFSRTPVVGILTRHDFMPEHILRLHPDLVGEGKVKRQRFFRGNGMANFLQGYLWGE